ncbi:MAG: hypothetical protein U0232_22435 [Thermomicrobiales bacterium]
MPRIGIAPPFTPERLLVTVVGALREAEVRREAAQRWCGWSRSAARRPRSAATWTGNRMVVAAIVALLRDGGDATPTLRWRWATFDAALEPGQIRVPVVVAAQSRGGRDARCRCGRCRRGAGATATAGDGRRAGGDLRPAAPSASAGSGCAPRTGGGCRNWRR